TTHIPPGEKAYIDFARDAIRAAAGGRQGPRRRHDRPLSEAGKQRSCIGGRGFHRPLPARRFLTRSGYWHAGSNTFRRHRPHSGIGGEDPVRPRPVGPPDPHRDRAGGGQRAMPKAAATPEAITEVITTTITRVDSGRRRSRRGATP